MDQSMQMVAIMQEFHWTFEEYQSTPNYVLTLTFGVVTALSAPLLLAIGAVVTILGVLAANGYTTKQAWEEVWLGIKVVAAQAANAVIGTVESMINFVISGVNKAIAAINKVISAAQKIPGIGKAIPSLKQISAVDLDRVDTDTIANSSFLGTAAKAAANATSVTLSGNVFLSTDVAEKIGDMIMSKLKLSNVL